MREIKFRGYCAEYNQWFYGVGIWQKYGGTRIVYDVTDDPNCEYKFMLDSYEVEKDSVGQYTGLKDCKGREIYEGDILQRIDGGVIKEVRFNAFYAMFETIILKSVEEYWTGSVSMLSKYICDNYHIIGNIYQNKDLLK